MSSIYAKTGKKGIFLNRNFLLLWIGGTISRLSWTLLIAGFGMWIITDLITNPTAASGPIKGIEGIAFLGLFTIGTLAGVFIDRWRDKKRVLVVTSIARACAVLLPFVAAIIVALTPLSASVKTSISLAAVYLFALAISILTHFAIPASYAILVDCVEEPDYAYANGLLLTATFACLPAGLAIDLFLFPLFNIYGILVLCALLYVVSYITSNSIQVETHSLVSQRRGIFREWGESIVFCLKNPLLLIMLFALVLINLWNGAFTILGNFYLSQNLHALPLPPVYGGVDLLSKDLNYTIEIGFAVGALVAGLFARRMGERRMISYSLLAAGLLMIVTTQLSTYLTGIAVVFAISILLGVVNVIIVPLYLWVTPWQFLGRVRSITDVVTNLMPLIAGGICLNLAGTSLGKFRTVADTTLLTFSTVTFLIVGIICTLGGVLVIFLLNNAKAAKFKKLDILSDLSASESVNENEEVRELEPTTSGR